MQEGWVKLWRKTIYSAVFKDDELFKLWLICLLKASHKRKQELFDKVLVALEPGEFITGRYAMWHDYYTYKTQSGREIFNPKKSASTIWNWLNVLKNMGNIDIKSNNKFSIISILNWDSYQGNDSEIYQQNSQQADNRLTTDSQQTNTNKNVKNVKNEEKKDIIPFTSIISYLNSKTKKNFSPKTKLYQQHIRARWHEGKRESDFQKVVDIKCAKWLTDEKMVDFCRPETLFGTKMDSYLQEGTDGDGGTILDPVERIRQIRLSDEADRAAASNAGKTEDRT